MVATWRFQACFGTISSSYEHYLEWKEVYPLTFAQAAGQLGVKRLNSQQLLLHGMLRPENLLDLVAHVHEMVHLDEPNHTPEFWRRMYRVLPDFPVHKRWLAEHGVELGV